MDNKQNYLIVVNNVLEKLKNNNIDRKHIDSCIIPIIIESIGTVPYNDNWYVVLDAYKNNKGHNINNFYGTGHSLNDIKTIEEIFMDNNYDINRSIKRSLMMLAKINNIDVNYANYIIMSHNTKINGLNVNKEFQTK